MANFRVKLMQLMKMFSVIKMNFFILILLNLLKKNNVLMIFLILFDLFYFYK